MLKKFINISLLVLISTLGAMAHAADNDNINGIVVDPNTGRGGEPIRTEDPNELKVCSDGDNMPFSNSKQEGFENKIADLIAKDLGKRVSYQFWVDRFGYIRNTLNAHRCDVIMGTVADNDMVLTSKPYYRSGYVFVYRKDSGYNIKDWDSTDLHKARIGVVGQTPPTRPLNDKGLLGNSRPYRIMRDLNLPPSYMVDDLVKGEIDVAILWGPIGGYYAKQAKIPLVVVPAPEYEDTNVHGKENWNISVAVRKKDKERMAVIQGALDRRKSDILKILDDYGIPHSEPVDNDNVEKKHESRGDVIPKSD